LCFSACSDDNEPELEEAVGFLRNGPEHYEECDWVIEVEGDYLKPSRLPIQYEQEGLEVFFTYEVLPTSTTCQEEGYEINTVRIIQIKPR
jgi:hypothetical protein